MDYGRITRPDGINLRRAQINTALVDPGKVPSTFPMSVWSSQTARYINYWKAYDGTVLEETSSNNLTKTKIDKYPLRVNAIRAFCELGAAFMMGQETSETYMPLVKSVVTPIAGLNQASSSSDEFSEEDKKLGYALEQILNRVWAQSEGRSRQLENATLMQFLGGAVFQVSYIPPGDSRRRRMQIPVEIKVILPDFFVPVWDNDYNLLEAYVVYRIPGHVARLKYNVSVPAGANQVTYCEHWTPTNYSVYIDSIPVSMDGVTYDALPNPFGFVPFVYIPHKRAGQFYGQSHVDDILWMQLELNRSMSQLGDAISGALQRRRYAVDVQTPTSIKLADGTHAISLGGTNLATKVSPNVFTEDPPMIADSVKNYPDSVWQMMLRMMPASDVMFGEGDASQRSSVALAMRMFPSIAHARHERTLWASAQNHIAWMILEMLSIKRERIQGFVVPEDFNERVLFSVDWLASVPRDRLELVSEIISRSQANLISPQQAIEMFRDVPFLEEEIDRIKDWFTFISTAGSTPSEGGEGSGPELVVDEQHVTGWGG